MKHYELAYLISPEVSEEEMKKIQEEIYSLIRQNEGVLDIEEKPPIRKRLAYPINKQYQAYLAVVYFSLSAEKIVELEKKLKSEKQILRYLILSKPLVKKLKAIRVFKKPKTKAEEKEKKPKVELKEIEKKLEEILSDNQ